MASLETDRPDLVSEWDFGKNIGISPSELGSSSHAKVWWICALGHGFRASIGNRAQNNTGCPVCANRIILPGFNDFATSYPELLAEWDFSRNVGLSPERIPKTYQKKVWWNCPLGHGYQAAPAGRTSNGTGCPVCAGKIVLTGFNDLASRNPKIAKEWDFERNGALTPQEVSWSSGRDVWWKCERGHEFHSRISSRSASGRAGRCPVCLNQTVVQGENDLASTHPSIAAEWNSKRNSGVLPASVVAGSSRKVWWVCSQDSRHEWEATPSARVRGRGCPICAHKRIVPGLNDFVTNWPEIALEWNNTLNKPVKPEELSPGSSSRRYWWTCVKGHDFKQTINARTNLRAGCPYCANQSLLRGYNDLQTLRPDLAVEWNYTLNGFKRPEDVLAGSKQKVWWQCSAYPDHSWSVSPSNRGGQRKTGCPICANKEVLKGFNDLQTCRPEIAKEWHETLNGDLTPSDFVSGSWTRVWWQCPNQPDHVYETRIVNRTSEKQNGCPTCAQTGFDQGAPGIFYILENQGLGAKKVGITNGTREAHRLRQFQRDGWQILATLKSENGRKVLQLETMMLRWIRTELKLPVYLSNAEMKSTGGHSETFEADAISFTEVYERARLFADEIRFREVST